MIRIVLFLVVIAVAALAATWIGSQTGDVVLSVSGWRIETSFAVFALALGVAIVAGIAVWSVLRGLWRMPRRLGHMRRDLLLGCRGEALS